MHFGVFVFPNMISKTIRNRYLVISRNGFRLSLPRWIASIRGVMIILIVLATIIPLGIILYLNYHREKDALSEGRILTERLTAEVAFDQQLLLSSAKQLMSTFPYNPAIRRRDGIATNAFLAEILGENPQITNLAVADEKGDFWASGLPMNAPINIADRRYFRNALATGRFSSGEFNIGRVRNKPTIIFGYPLKDGSGRITDVAIVSLSSDRYDRYFQSAGLETEGSLALLDHKGMVLFARPSSGLVGRQDRDDLFRKMTAGPEEGSFEAVGLTGIPRIFTYRKLHLPGESEPYMYVRAGIAVSSILARTRKDFIFGIGLIAGTAILILLLGVLLSKRFVLDNVSALKETTERLSRGDLTTRVPETVSGGELGELGAAFNSMAYKLQEADARRHEAEEERNRLAAAIEQAGETVVITDPDGNIQYVNPAFERTTGYSREDAIGRNPRVLNSGKQDEAFYRHMWETISAGHTWEGRMVNKRKDATYYTEDATISPVFDATGKIVNYVAVKRDITEHLRLADQFQQSQKMESVGRLAGGVAHDFNNLLTVITGYSELLLQKIGKESPMRGEVEEIRRAGERAASLTQQLLAFSRKQIIAPKILDLNDLTADVGKLLVRLIGENIDLKIGHGKNLCLVKVDPGQFEQVLINMAVNARDAMPNSGTLLIETENVELDEEYCAQRPYEIHPGRFVKLAVSDTGHGMTKETCEQIFEPFFTTKEKGKGTGLGLSMVYGVVKQAGGYIEVNSEVGRGTTFKIYLPCLEGDVVKTVEDELSSNLPKGTETVLLVEDESSVRNLGVRILGELGYKVMQAGNGDEAISLAAGYKERIDLLLTDVVMPGMNGSELAAQLVLYHPEAEVLFSSGYTDDTISRHGTLDEGVSFIGKPYTPLELAKKVRDVLDKA